MFASRKQFRVFFQNLFIYLLILFFHLVHSKAHALISSHYITLNRSSSHIDFKLISKEWLLYRSTINEPTIPVSFWKSANLFSIVQRWYLTRRTLSKLIMVDVTVWFSPFSWSIIFSEQWHLRAVCQRLLLLWPQALPYQFCFNFFLIYSHFYEVERFFLSRAPF